MDPPVSLILDYLYLGSAWNAGNLEELRTNGVTHILNVTREIDNHFPASLVYKNVRVYDEETTDLLKHFETTYRFIRQAKATGGKVRETISIQNTVGGTSSWTANVKLDTR